jgi:hypothetical protein
MTNDPIQLMPETIWRLAANAKVTGVSDKVLYARYGDLIADEIIEVRDRLKTRGG